MEKTKKKPLNKRLIFSLLRATMYIYYEKKNESDELPLINLQIPFRFPGKR
jgi:hypothetical protein